MALLSRLLNAWITNRKASDAAFRKLSKHDEDHGAQGGDLDSPLVAMWLAEMDMAEVAMDRTAATMVDTVSWLESLSVASMYPDAPYHRTFTAIKTLE